MLNIVSRRFSRFSQNYTRAYRRNGWQYIQTDAHYTHTHTHRASQPTLNPRNGCVPMHYARINTFSYIPQYSFTYKTPPNLTPIAVWQPRTLLPTFSPAKTYFQVVRLAWVLCSTLSLSSLRDMYREASWFEVRAVNN